MTSLQNVRVVQRNLVYIVGLPMECCFEDVLMSQEYIGQFGKIVKVRICLKLCCGCKIRGVSHGVRPEADIHASK